MTIGNNTTTFDKLTLNVCLTLKRTHKTQCFLILSSKLFTNRNYSGNNSTYMISPQNSACKGLIEHSMHVWSACQNQWEFGCARNAELSLQLATGYIVPLRASTEVGAVWPHTTLVNQQEGVLLHETEILPKLLEADFPPLINSDSCHIHRILGVCKWHAEE